MSAASVWLDAWLRGAAGSDDLLEFLARVNPDAPPAVSIDGARQQPLGELLRGLRDVGGHRTWLLLPRPGRTVGWPTDVDGAPEPAVLVSGDAGICCLLRSGRFGWRWDSCDCSVVVALEAGMLTARSGARALAEIVTGAAERLERLGLERPAVRTQNDDWASAMRRLPRGIDPQLEALLMRLAALHDALDLALGEPGAAITAAESLARAGELRAVVGSVEDIICGLVGGLNAPAPATGAGR